MRRLTAVAIAVGLYTGVESVRSARAGEVYMSFGGGPSAPGTGAFGKRFDATDHAGGGVVVGVELADTTLDVRMAMHTYSDRAQPMPGDEFLVRVGLDLGRRIWLTRRLAIGAAVGLGLAGIDNERALKGTSWSLAGSLEYVLGRFDPRRPSYSGPLDYLGASIVVEARREQLSLGSEVEAIDSTINLITAGLRFGMGF